MASSQQCTGCHGARVWSVISSIASLMLLQILITMGRPQHCSRASPSVVCVVAAAALQAFLIIMVVVSILGAGVAGAAKADAEALKRFILSADPNNHFQQNWRGDDPCSGTVWRGVSCSMDGNVTSLVLNSQNLQGTIPEGTLGQLSQLRLLSLSRNGLISSIPMDLINCTQLKHVYLNGNQLSGSIPSPLSARIRRLFLSDNKLSGSVPPSFTNLSSLISLQLENNRLTGTVPAFNQINLTSFNISNNMFTGPIPVTSTLKRFNESSFSENPSLCGDPLPPCLIPSTEPPLYVSQSNESKAGNAPTVKKAPQRTPGRHLSPGSIVAIVIGDFALLLAVTFLFILHHKKISIVVNKRESSATISDGEMGEGQASLMSNMEDEKPKLIFFEFQYKFRLEELLRAPAEFLGKGVAGSVYRAILDEGTVAAVKRLHMDLMRNLERAEFDRQMEILGNIRHANIVPLWAYYHGKDERLLVFGFQPNGTLFSLLHSGSDPAGEAVGRKPSLSWDARLRIIRGVANGLAYLHHHAQSLNMPHGNLKSSNILLNQYFDACISDFGLQQLVPPSVAGLHIGRGYKAPEYDATRKISLEMDVYSFGVVLLELLTGRRADDGSSVQQATLPQWVNAVVQEEWTAEVFDAALIASKATEEALVSLLQIGMACVSTSPDKRPRMAQVLEMIKQIKEDDDYTEIFSTANSPSR